MDTEERRKREKERRNDLFARRELGALLRLFSSLGITVAAGIVGFFFLGVFVERKALELGYRTGGALRIAFLLAGVGLSVYWAYLRIAKHIETFDGGASDGDGDAAS
jgi:hypothetical protein